MEMLQMTDEQQQAANAAQALTKLLSETPLDPGQLPKLHLLLGRAFDATRHLIEVIEEQAEPKPPRT